tara:strand:- start:3174 stop:3872 length:699 start_codon:yes stop_codon:yes gene_type:complete
MKLSRRQLKRIIEQTIAPSIQSEPVLTKLKKIEKISGVDLGTYSNPANRQKLISQIDWVKCSLPDAQNWTGYTQRAYKMSLKTGGNEGAQQFLGAITVPIRWEGLVEASQELTKMLQALAGDEVPDGWFDARSGYDSYVKFYQSVAKGRDVHSVEFNKMFFDYFVSELRELVNGFKALRFNMPSAAGSKGGPVLKGKIIRDISFAARKFFLENPSKYADCLPRDAQILLRKN